jgi:CheY-like chemotaxis protein
MTESPDETMPQASPTDESAPYRVLVVEDDRSQALFAQSVLNGAGIEATLQTEAAGVLDAIRAHKPDLVLMDLHLPEIDGMRLTALIRQQPGLQLLPIVFLSGDRTRSASSSARQRRRRLPEQADPAAPPDRRRGQPHPRARAQAQASSPRHPGPAIRKPACHPPAPVADDRRRIAHRDQGGVFFIEIASALGLRERYGYAAFERLMVQAGRRLAKAGPAPCWRLNDNSFLLLARIDDEDAWKALPRAARAAVAPRLRDPRRRIRASARRGRLCRAVAGLRRCGSRARSDRAHHPAGTPAAPAWPPRPATRHRTGEPGLLEGQLELAYQPIVAVAGGNTAQYQLLLRLRQADGTLLAAGQVIPAAEAAGRIADLDQQVMDHALDDARPVPANAPLRLFVSQSLRTLPRCLRGLAAGIAAAARPPGSRW